MSCIVRNDFVKNVDTLQKFVASCGELEIKAAEKWCVIKTLQKISFLPDKEIYFELLVLEPELYEIYSCFQSFEAIARQPIFADGKLIGTIVYTIPRAKFKELSPLGGELNKSTVFSGKILKEYDTDTMLEFKKKEIHISNSK